MEKGNWEGEKQTEMLSVTFLALNQKADSSRKGRVMAQSTSLRSE
jgi:hypothetical protein